MSSKTAQTRQTAKARKTAKKRLEKKLARTPPPWTPLVEVPQDRVLAQHPAGDREMMADVIAGTRIFANHLYQVIVTQLETTAIGPLVQLAVSRLDQGAVHDWRHLQLIKNAILGAESEAVELYPAESRLLDASNTMYLFGLPPTTLEDGRPAYGRFPFGFDERVVSERPPAGRQQRPWDPPLQPADLQDLSLAGMRRRYAERKAAEAQADDSPAGDAPVPPTGPELDSGPADPPRDGIVDPGANAGPPPSLHGID